MQPTKEQNFLRVYNALIAKYKHLASSLGQLKFNIDSLEPLNLDRMVSFDPDAMKKNLKPAIDKMNSLKSDQNDLFVSESKFYQSVEGAVNNFIDDGNNLLGSLEGFYHSEQ